MKTQNDVGCPPDCTAPRGTARAVRAMRFMWCAALLVSALSIQQLSARRSRQGWAKDGCWYTLKGRVYVTELCRRLVAAHTLDYSNPVRREWLLRIEDNPANLYQDVTFLQGPMHGWTARLARRGLARTQCGQGFGPSGIRKACGPTLSLRVETRRLCQAARDAGTLINNYFNNRGVGMFRRAGVPGDLAPLPNRALLTGGRPPSASARGAARTRGLPEDSTDRGRQNSRRESSRRRPGAASGR